jgi:SMC interacting uncharacterized protein involved in chromosome segregation
MNEKNYKKKLNFQQNVISKKSEEIEYLKSENEKLERKLKEKDEIIASVEPMRKEMAENVKELKRCKDEYKSLIEEVRKMKKIINREVYKNRWWLIKFLLK